MVEEETIFKKVLKKNSTDQSATWDLHCSNWLLTHEKCYIRTSYACYKRSQLSEHKRRSCYDNHGKKLQIFPVYSYSHLPSTMRNIVNTSTPRSFGHLVNLVHVAMKLLLQTAICLGLFIVCIWLFWKWKFNTELNSLTFRLVLNFLVGQRIKVLVSHHVLGIGKRFRECV